MAPRHCAAAAAPSGSALAGASMRLRKTSMITGAAIVMRPMMSHIRFESCGPLAGQYVAKR